MKLITRPECVGSLLGFEPAERFLVPNTALDARHVRTPVVLERAPGAWWLFLEGIEEGSIESARFPEDIRVAYYAQYLWWDPPDTRAIPESLDEAIRHATGDRGVDCDAWTSVGLARAVGAGLAADVENPWLGRWSVKRVPRQEIVRQLEADRESATRLATRSFATSPDAHLLEACLDEIDASVRFRSLDDALTAGGIDALVVTSGINVEDVAGVAAVDEAARVLAVVRRGEDVVWLVTSDGHGSPLAEIAAQLGLHGGVIAVEEDDLTLGQSAALEMDDDCLRWYSRELREWRDGLSLVELPYFMVAAAITTAAISRTIQFVADHCRSGRLTELDVLHQLDRNYAVATADLAGTSFRSSRSHVNLHASSRTRRPALPTRYEIPPDEHALEIDSGVRLVDRAGRIRASTDMCRSYVAGTGGEELYRLLKHAVTEVGIPASRAGATGGDIFGAVTGMLDTLRADLERTGLAPTVPSYTEGYDRYVGHTVGKQRYVHSLFTRDVRRPLHFGQLGAIELPWAMGAYGFSYEDMFVAHNAKGINLTATVVNRV